jgi:hypothetical protein
MLATIPFLTKPFHIDDPADLQHVQHVMRAPLDPYGFQVDWDEGPHPAFLNYHPPLKYYYHALILTFLPISEVALHVSFLPFVALTAWAVMSLAKRFGSRPLLLLAFWLLGPGYLPGQNAMLDVPAMALGLTATALLIASVDANRMIGSMIAGAILGAALLTKYSSLVYVPVWIGYLLAHGRMRHGWSLAIALTFFALWNILSKMLYGQAHAMVLLSGLAASGDPARIVRSGMVGIVFLGGAMPLATALLWVNIGRGRLILLLAGIITAFVAVLAPPTRNVVGGSPYLTPINFAWWCLLAWSGTAVLLRMTHSFLSLALRHRSQNSAGPIASAGSDDLFLSVWFVATLAIGCFGAPFMAMRRVVEACVPAYIILLRRLEPGTKSRPALLAPLTNSGALIITGLLGMLVAAADFEFATSYRNFAGDLADVGRKQQSRLWCHGYWGWSYYTRHEGLRHVVLGSEQPPAGALMVIPAEVAKPATLPDEIRFHATKQHEQVWRGYLPIRLMNHWAGAGYYGAAWGPLPYAWSRFPLEVFEFYELNGGNRPLPSAPFPTPLTQRR